MPVEGLKEMGIFPMGKVREDLVEVCHGTRGESELRWTEKSIFLPVTEAREGYRWDSMTRRFRADVKKEEGKARWATELYP